MARIEISSITGASPFDVYVSGDQGFTFSITNLELCDFTWGACTKFLRTDKGVDILEEIVLKAIWIYVKKNKLSEKYAKFYIRSRLTKEDANDVAITFTLDAECASYGV